MTGAKDFDFAPIQKLGGIVSDMKARGLSAWHGDCPSCGAENAFRVVLVGPKQHFRAACGNCKWSAMQ